MARTRGRARHPHAEQLARRMAAITATPAGRLLAGAHQGTKLFQRFAAGAQLAQRGAGDDAPSLMMATRSQSRSTIRARGGEEDVARAAPVREDVLHQAGAHRIQPSKARHEEKSDDGSAMRPWRRACACPWSIRDDLAAGLQLNSPSTRRRVPWRWGAQPYMRPRIPEFGAGETVEEQRFIGHQPIRLLIRVHPRGV